MWGSFVLAAMFALILLYLPGYLLGRVFFLFGKLACFCPCTYDRPPGFAGRNSFPLEPFLVCPSFSCAIGKYYHFFDIS